MVGETNSMVGYHLMAKDHSIQLGDGGHCEFPSRCRTAPWWELEFFENTQILMKDNKQITSHSFYKNNFKGTMRFDGK